jgi:tubulin-like protein
MAVRLQRLDGLMSSVRYSGGGQFCPTLVIGLGGSGINTARRVKRIQDSRYGPLRILRYLFVDTDQGAYAIHPELADVDPAEQASIVTTNATRVHDEVKRGLREEIASFLPDAVDVSILEHADGAGGIRPAGRFAFYNHLQHVYDNRLGPACADVLGVRALVDTSLAGAAARIDVSHSEPRVYIINSICGGTGSSAFLDMALLTRHLLRQSQVEPSIIGLFFLPSVFRNERAITPIYRETILANGYAGLMELEYFCDPNVGSHGWAFDYPQVGRVQVDRPIFDECYLIEGTNARGQQLATKDEVFEMTARSICVDIGSPVGARTRSAKRNTIAVLRTNPCRETGKLRLMNSLVTTGLRVPIEAMARHGGLHAARAIIRNHLVGFHPPLAELEGEIDVFLSANGLEERGRQDQLIERVLTGPDGHALSFSLGTERSELEADAEGAGLRGERGQAQYVSGWVGQKLEALRSSQLPRARTIANSNKPVVLREAVTAVRQQLEQYARQQGLARCQAFLEELITVFGVVVEELAQESRIHEEGRRNTENEIQSQREFLNRYGSLIDLVMRREDDERAMDSVLELTQRHGAAEITEIGRRAALDLLNSQAPIEGMMALLPQLQEWLRLVKDARSALTDAEKFIAGELDRRVMPTETASTYVLEQQLVPPSRFEELYRGANLGLPMLAQGAWKLLEADGSGDLAALERLRGYQDHPADLADLIAAEGGRELLQYLEQRANIMQVIHQQKDASESDAQYLQRQLQLMFDICHPFWTTSSPVGMDSYERFMAVTIPVRAADPRTSEVRQAVEQVVRQAGYTPELVETDYPFALEISTRAYGARAYYLGSTGEMKAKYEAKMEQPAVRGLVHMDRRFIDALPKLHPVPPDQAKLYFAWGLAYGYIARRGESYYLGVQRSHRDGRLVLTPRYQSDGPTITDLMDERWRGEPQQHLDEADLLAADRFQAMSQFTGSSDRVQQVIPLPDRYAQERGAQRVVEELTTYLQRIDEIFGKTDSPKLREQYADERAQIERYLKRLQGYG